MAPAAEQYDELPELLTAMSDRGLSAAQAERLANLMRNNPSAQQLYLDFVELHTMMAWQYRENGVRAARPQDEYGVMMDASSRPAAFHPSAFSIRHSAPSSLPPIIIQILPTPLSPQPSFFGSALFSYLIAVVIVGVALLVAAAWKLSELPQMVDRESPSAALPSPLSPRPSVVGRITGMVDCTWSDPETEALVGAYVPLGRRYALASGLMEITYNTGAKVILQGPVTYEVESPAGGYLSVGKLTARLEKRSVVSGQRSESVNQKSEIIHPKSPDLCPLTSDLFAIRTPTAMVTDLGTEFGVEVDRQGFTKSHVFRGSIKVQLGAAAGVTETGARVLQENESAYVSTDKAARPTFSAVSLDPDAFVRSLPEQLPIRLFNTGVGLKEGDADPHWQVVAVSNDPSFKPRSTFVVAGFSGEYWLENQPSRSQWISIVPAWTPQPHGITYTYRTTFDLNGLQPDTAKLRIRVIGDNHVQAIRLNGRRVAVPPHSFEQMRYERFLMVLATRGFVSGTNVVEIDVENGLPDVPQRKSSETGLRVELDGHAISEWRAPQQASPESSPYTER